MTLTEKAILLIKGMIFLFKAKQGGKYLSRKEIIDRRTGKKSYRYKYKPMQQRAAHEVTRSKFEKVTKLSGDEHKNQIEHALQNNIRVSLHVLRDYPDLAKKYGQIGRIEQADKIRARVKSHKQTSDTKPMAESTKENSLMNYVKNLPDSSYDLVHSYNDLQTASEIIRQNGFGSYVDGDYPTPQKDSNGNIYFTTRSNGFIHSFKAREINGKINLYSLKSSAYTDLENYNRGLSQVEQPLDPNALSNAMEGNDNAKKETVIEQEIPKEKLHPSDIKYKKIADNLFKEAASHGFTEGSSTPPRLTRKQIEKYLKGTGETIESLLARPYENQFRLMKLSGSMPGHDLHGMYTIIRKPNLSELLPDDVKEQENNFDTMPESEIKNVIKDKLIKLGGKEFIKDNTHRIYFNEGFLRRAFGLYTKKHPNGMDSLYFEGGKETTASKYNHTNESLRSGKVNFDLNNGVFHINMRGKGNFDGLRLASGQVEDIVNYINKETGLNIPYEALWKNKLPLKDSLPKDNFDTMPESKPEPAKLVNEPATLKTPEEMKPSTENDITHSPTLARFTNAKTGKISQYGYGMATSEIATKLGMPRGTNYYAEGKLNKRGVFVADKYYPATSEQEAKDKARKLVEPAAAIKSPDLKANFEAWKEERKQASTEVKAPVSPKETDVSKIMTSLDKHIQKEYLAKNPNFKPTSSKTLQQYTKEVFSDNPNWLRQGNFYNSDEKAKAIEKRYNKDIMDEYYYGFGSDEQFKNAIIALNEDVDAKKAKLNRYYGDKHLLTKDQFAKVLDATDPKNKDHYLNEWQDSIKNSSNGETPSGKKIPQHVLDSVIPPKPQTPAFKLEADDLTSTEKLNRFNDKQGGLFGKKPQEKYVKKDFKPTLTLEGNESIESLVTAIKSALLKEGLDVRAREFVDRAFKEKDIASLKKMASEYVDVKENAQVPKPATDDKGREEKKMSELSNDPKTLYTEVRGMYTSLNPFDFVELAKPYLDKIESIGATNFGNFNYRGTIVGEIERVEKLKSAGITKNDLELPDLPSLQGSEKQIPWANKIREEKLQQFYNTILRNSYRPLKGFDKEKANKIKEKVQNNSAKFWIDNRQTSIDSMIN